ncbi:nicotinate phosphoribosyltransferase [Priestia koreensis]|uniref:nicotinate phosphoribosyltransferase n=1 Tax=Priestia koreensis TaxID=284581 RepID=UPI001F58AA42|nr:nicotinate phosphoribosyltransferase [Priestia koreensis]MCM3003534.1 nicotinate phosphoribosyltransferase [Priestia koreensis]UNL86325.1 nicotinate phosphoribosyltransferase [Priestia koreensis]
MYSIDDSKALHTDLYQINMVETYWADGIHEKKSVFDLYFRKLPFQNGYAVFAGLEKIVRYLEQFQFTKNDIEYLRNLGYQDDFLAYLETIRFTGTVHAMREGEIAFENEPIIRIEATLAEAQLIETGLLNIVNYQTLIATKASRIRHLSNDDELLEFGTRRAHEFDAALWGARAAYIGGFNATSNVRAGKLFDIPVAGTHAHAMIQAYQDEYTAFKAYAKRHRDCVFLVDTYDTLRSGIPNAIRVAKELGDDIRFIGIRLDSGDLAYLSKQARAMLDEAGFHEAKIVVSNDLDEETILNLKSQGAKIDVWGVGTKLITAYDNPALGAVYKLVAIEGQEGTLEDTIKISANPEKVTTPGLKKVYRIINMANQKSEGDYIALDHEHPEKETKLKMFHPTHTFVSKFVTNFYAKDLHVKVFDNGVLTYELPSTQDIQEYAKASLNDLWDEYKRTLNAESYPVDLSEACWNHKMSKISEEQEKVAAMQVSL